MQRVLGFRIADTLRATFNQCYVATLIGHQYDYDQIRATAAAAQTYAEFAPSDKTTLADMRDKLSGLVAETLGLLEKEHAKNAVPSVELVTAFTSAVSAHIAVDRAHKEPPTPQPR